MTILPVAPSLQIYLNTAMSNYPQVKQKKMSHYVLQTISIRGESGPITDIINFKLADNSTNNSELQSNEQVPEALPPSAEENQNYRSQKHMCNKCYKPFSQFNELKNHLAFCHFEGGYHLRKAEMLKNIEKIEKDATNMETNDICFCCGESYDTFHLGQINCDHCPKSFKTQMSYERHVFITHSEFDQFPCSICNAKLRTGHLLKLHEKQHKTRGRLFACKVCGKDFGRIDHLKRHQKYTACSASANDTISCKVCNKDFSRLDNLRKHLKHHLCIQLTKREKFMCPICKNCFYSLWN
ncbi:protein suppressor of hairy wing-like, partial [Teleopsis dalmanni]|uniref:protein suppressor of hairy wing-like n=1 Tax=Teleopsis dalmanni TaxID=139649 RepID=UPI0018CFA998